MSKALTPSTAVRTLTGAQKPETLVQNFEEPADVAIFDGFIDMAEAQLKELYDSLNLAIVRDSDSSRGKGC